MASPDEPFSYLARADGSIVIRYGDAPLALLRGKAAARFAVRVGAADAAAAQLLMARATRSVRRAKVRGDGRAD